RNDVVTGVGVHFAHLVGEDLCDVGHSGDPGCLVGRHVDCQTVERGAVLVRDLNRAPERFLDLGDGNVVPVGEVIEVGDAVGRIRVHLGVAGNIRTGRGDPVDAATVRGQRCCIETDDPSAGVGLFGELVVVRGGVSCVVL